MMRTGLFAIFMLSAGLTAAQEPLRADSAGAGDTIVPIGKQVIRGRKSPMPKESEQAARIPLKNLENPQAYSVVTKETLKQQGITSYSEALRAVPGIVSEGSKPGVRSWP